MTWAHLNAEGCVEGKSPRLVVRLHSEEIPLATLAGGLLVLSLVHKPGRLELSGVIARFLVIQNWANDMHQRLEAIFHPGDRGHSSLHGVVECFPPWAVHSHIVRAFAAGLRCMGHAVASGLEEIAERELETAEWSSVVFDLQRVSTTC